MKALAFVSSAALLLSLNSLALAAVTEVSVSGTVQKISEDFDASTHKFDGKVTAGSLFSYEGQVCEVSDIPCQQLSGIMSHSEGSHFTRNMQAGDLGWSFLVSGASLLRTNDIKIRNRDPNTTYRIFVTYPYEYRTPANSVPSLGVILSCPGNSELAKDEKLDVSETESDWKRNQVSNTSAILAPAICPDSEIRISFYANNVRDIKFMPVEVTILEESAL